MTTARARPAETGTDERNNGRLTPTAAATMNRAAATTARPSTSSVVEWAGLVELAGPSNSQSA